MAREQRLVFGEVADSYQRARPSYPDGLFDAIVELSGLASGDPVLDVGAGTGKATESLVARGFDVSAVEPSPEMARVLQSRFPDVAVHVSGFEDAPLEPAAFALVTAAQSWHWVDPERGATKAADVLRPGGWIALFWNTADLDGCEWHEELQPLYERYAPPMSHENIRARNAGAVQDNIHKLVDSGRFGPTVVRHIPWVERYSTDAYVSLLGTHSDHRMLPEAQRLELHNAIAASIDARGGEVVHPYRTDLVAAHVR
jgi:SAM-dependent methyltransferase